MHGGLNVAEIERGSVSATVKAWLYARRMFLMIVVLPTVVSALYFGLIRADEYSSEAHFVVRSAASRAETSYGLGQLLGLAGDMQPSQAESLALGDYLTSHDAVSALQKSIDLTAVFRRPESDLLSRMWHSHPTPETLLKYYRGKVTVHYNGSTGITEMEVHSFRPDDSYRLAQLLLELGEQRVNDLNRRAYASSLEVARRQLDEAETLVQKTQGNVTEFRQADRDVDPERSAGAQLQVVSQLRGQLALARAARASLGSNINANSPQAHVLDQRVASLETQVANENSRLAGSGQTIASGLGKYEGIRLRQDFAAKRYSAAAAAYESAREQALKQQLFVVRIVDPNMPVKSLFPKRGTIIATVFAALLLAYGIGVLIVAGFREHAA